MKVILLFLLSYLAFSQELYFPSESEWETISPDDLEWKSEQIPELISYLNENNTKAFIVLKSGKIVIEEYFDDFTQDSSWYWASAGKTVTATLIGIAQEKSLL